MSKTLLKLQSFLTGNQLYLLDEPLLKSILCICKTNNSFLELLTLCVKLGIHLFKVQQGQLTLRTNRGLIKNCIKKREMFIENFNANLKMEHNLQKISGKMKRLALILEEIETLIYFFKKLYGGNRLYCLIYWNSNDVSEYIAEYSNRVVV